MPVTEERTRKLDTQKGEEGGIRISVNQIEYTVGPSGPLVHVFGRDQNRVPVHVVVTGFRPYLYVPADLAAANPPSPPAEIEPGKRLRGYLQHVSVCTARRGDPGGDIPENVATSFRVL